MLEAQWVWNSLLATNIWSAGKARCGPERASAIAVKLAAS